MFFVYLINVFFSQQDHHALPVHHRVHLVVIIIATIVEMYFSQDNICHIHLLATVEQRNGRCQEMKCQEGKNIFCSLISLDS